ncbi:serine/threonine-protein kinase [Nocardia sp. NPDC003482]
MAQSLTHGQVFAGYRIERLLGVGGMGEVYLAHDRDLPRWVALKILHPAVGDDASIRARFLHEADTAARLAHPNIVTVYARGQEGGRLWIAMQYVDGVDAAAAVRGGGPIPAEHAVHIVTEVAKALDHAHAAGVLHRDVKPANILLSSGPAQQVFLADFGIAKALDQADQFTRAGELFASFQYAAPEQFDTRADVDRRADVYALGCTLYFLLTGALPYPGTTTGQLIHGHLNLPAPRPSRENPGVPSGFDAVIARALAKNRDDRYAGCGELAAAARRALPASAPPRRRAARIALVLVGAVALVAATAAGAFAAHSTWTRGRVDSARDAARQAGCEYARLLATYDYDKLDGWETAVLDRSSGDLHASLVSTLPDNTKAIATSHGHSHVTDITCTAQSADLSSAEITVVLTQVYRNDTVNQRETTKAQQFRLVMERLDGRWLCRETTIIGGNN